MAKKSTKIEVSMTPEQKKAIKDAAERIGMSGSMFLLTAGLKEAKKESGK